MNSESIARARARWHYRGDTHPPFAREPNPGQESVWDYPRPPRCERDPRRVRIARMHPSEANGSSGDVARSHHRSPANDCEIADSTRAVRILETASPPTFYLPPTDVCRELLVPGRGESHCEWKGIATYWSLCIADQLFENVAWSYPDPYAGFEHIRDYLSFYPARVQILLNDERVQSQPGRFYGGWVTREVVGPFKGEPGSEDW